MKNQREVTKTLHCAWLLPFCFMTEAFVWLQLFHQIHASWWWMLWFVLQDAATAKIFRKLNNIASWNLEGGTEGAVS
jgi:hypothetical protein